MAAAARCLFNRWSYFIFTRRTNPPVLIQFFSSSGWEILSETEQRILVFLWTECGLNYYNTTRSSDIFYSSYLDKSINRLWKPWLKSTFEPFKPEPQELGIGQTTSKLKIHLSFEARSQSIIILGNGFKGICAVLVDFAHCHLNAVQWATLGIQVTWPNV